jgi:mannose-1-phosphate guanylyltransferase/mannose-6-phosphate isomerase
MKTIILAGGSGTRLWPMSRQNFPKQFLALGTPHSLLQKTLQRHLKASSAENIWVVTHQDYAFHVANQLKVLSKKNILLEPVAKNTAPALLLALTYLRETDSLSDEEVLFVSPADHLLSSDEIFIQQLDEVEILAKQGHIVTLGVTPDRPETGYGYIRKDAAEFVEKPDYPTACAYVASGNYLWNSGMFAFTLKTIRKEMETHAPDLWKYWESSVQELLHFFPQMPEISLDYAVMEKSKNLLVLPLKTSWSDVGSLDSLYTIMEKDDDQNVKLGNVVTLDTKDSLIMGSKRLISTTGIDNLLIVETEDALLVAKRGESQQVKQLVVQLSQQGRKETQESSTTYRPWGNYKVLEEGDRDKIKRITVEPGERLSLQMHHHRSEHWVIVKGIAKVTIGTEEKIVCENESIYVPKCTLHRLENPSTTPLEIIEVQVGDYLEEDDIVRFEDKYERCSSADLCQQNS